MVKANGLAKLLLVFKVGIILRLSNEEGPRETLLFYLFPYSLLMATLTTESRWVIPPAYPDSHGHCFWLGSNRLVTN